MRAAELGPVTGNQRANAAYQLRKELARRNHDVPAPRQSVNGDDARYADRLNSYTKGLGRDTLGVHFRSDGDEGLRLREELAIRVLQDLIHTYNEDVEFRFNRFDGTPVVITQRHRR